MNEQIPVLEKELELVAGTDAVVAKAADLKVATLEEALKAFENDKDTKAMGSIYDLIPRTSIDLSDMVPKGLDVVQMLDLGQLKENMEQDFSVLMEQIDKGLVIEGENLSDPVLVAQLKKDNPGWQDHVV